MNGVVLLILLFGFSGWASAAYYEDYHAANTYLAWGDSYDWTHTLDGFVVGEEEVNYATLTLGFVDYTPDTNWTNTEYAFLIGAWGDWSIFSVDTGFSEVELAVYSEFNSTGSASFIVTALGDFAFVGSGLTAGTSYTTPTVSGVPNPATVWLFGSALLCMIGFSRWPVRTSAEVTTA